MQNAPLDSGCAGLGLMSSTTPSRTETSEPQCTEHSVQVDGTTFTSPARAGAVVIAAPYGRSRWPLFVSPRKVIRKHSRGNAARSLKQKTRTPVKSASSPRAGLREPFDRAASLRAPAQSLLRDRLGRALARRRRFFLAVRLLAGDRQLQHVGALARHQPGHHHDLAARKFERIVMHMRIVHVDL